MVSFFYISVGAILSTLISSLEITKQKNHPFAGVTQCLAEQKPGKLWLHPTILSSHIKRNLKQGNLKTLPFTTHWDSILKYPKGLFFSCLKVLYTILSLSSFMFLWCQFVNGTIIVSDELPSYPGRTEKLHSFNKEAVFQFLLKGKKNHTSAWNSAHLSAREKKNLHYARDETLFLLSSAVIGLMQHCMLVCGF